MYNTLKNMVLAGALSAPLLCMAGPRVTCRTMGNTTGEDGRPCYALRFEIDSAEPFSRLAFCAFKRPMTAVNPSDTVVELLPGYFAVGSPRFTGEGPIQVDVRVTGSLRNISYMPDGVHLVDMNGRPVSVEYTLLSTTASPTQWITPDGKDGMIYGPEAFVINDSLRATRHPGHFRQVIPTPQVIDIDTTRFSTPSTYTVILAEGREPGYWSATIKGDTVTVAISDMLHRDRILSKVRQRIEAEMTARGIPQGTIAGWPEYQYRGFMLDVVRNFTSIDEIKRMVDVMADYGFNTLHFHLGDDEGWRVEMPSLPELTAVGGRRGYTTTDDVDFLKQIYSGNGNPDDPTTPANGFYDVDTFVDFLKYADSKGIAVIPEFDTPGHSRAAIRAMEHRYRTTGDPTLRLIHDGDTSEYTSAQSLHDNVMNPALEGPYIFWGMVFDDIKAIYDRAGIELPAVHIGGDEVPKHAWDGSDRVAELCREKGFDKQSQVHAYFVDRVVTEAAKRGIKVVGWQEMALDHGKEYDNRVAPHVAGINCWTNAGDQGSRIAAAGYPLILSNVDYLYLDQTPNMHPEEPGLTWGGRVDEFQPLKATIDRLCPGPAEVQDNVVGISGHLFAETVRNPAMIQRYLLPRILGIAERAHHKNQTLDQDEYFHILTSEMPSWQNKGLDFYLRQPGIRLNEDGLVEMNSAYPFGEIRYTLDGSDPTPESTLYTAPFAPGESRHIRARLFMLPARSVTSILIM